jgi:hypothetical protein
MVASSGRRWAEPRSAGPPIVGRTRVRPPAALVATPTPWWSLPQPVRAIMAPGCSVLRCFVVWASPVRLSPNTCDPQKALDTRGVACTGPAASRTSRVLRLTAGLELSGRQTDSRRVEDVKFRLLARALRLCRRRLFSRSMICTRVVQAKPCPDYTSSTDPLSVRPRRRPPACPSPRTLVGAHMVIDDGGARLLLPQQKRVAFLPLSSLFRGKHDSF